MPLYEYQCQECGEVTEVVQKFEDAPLTICSSCGGQLKKLLSAPAIQFKGSGWYVTDYAKGSSTKTPSTDSKPKSDASSAPSGPKSDD